MTVCVGGSRDGIGYAGHKHTQKTLVLPKRGADGRDVRGQFELYQRDTPGGPWIYRRDGTNDTGEDWYFPE